ncbi:MAG: glycosyltransferase [Bryobacteraceae bacterium]|nr:glycosyltransferase [Bryobacteraceae bacterium]
MDETQPAVKVTVLLVSYNCAAALRRSLEALERTAERESVEILVVDNGSRDESGQVDQEFASVTVLRIPRNFGLTKARNIGVRTAKGDYIFLLEPGVEVLPETIPALVARMETDATAGAVCPLLMNTEGNVVSRAGKLPSPGELFRWWRGGESYLRPLPGGAVAADAGEAEAFPVECPDPRAVLVRRLFIKGMNYFDERYGQFGSSLELFFQVRRAGKRILVLGAAQALHAEGDGLWTPSESVEHADLDADYASGIIAFAAKHYGFGAGLKLRTFSILAALAGFRFGVVSRLVSCQKIDGSQTGV